MKNSLVRATGIALAATGGAHFVAPEIFEDLTQAAFPQDTETWIKRNGATEVALGLGLVSRRTRKLASVGLLAYVGHLAFRMAGNRKG
ncbi:hypothetical protein [Nocardioides massiliensis]|uniref:Membrane protein n=1 Tax=Nocardioides massiliensis TaxID=1325935 RepID=A0ABT9NQZ4_9ACTN|nr:hypothetical protein [Nocardioides massiliensis]MDP9822480.1 putative membrane protein [Nocardioides massiliensis]